jgi:hypothetical protein
MQLGTSCEERVVQTYQSSIAMVAVFVRRLHYVTFFIATTTLLWVFSSPFQLLICICMIRRSHTKTTSEYALTLSLSYSNLPISFGKLSEGHSAKFFSFIYDYKPAAAPLWDSDFCSHHVNSCGKSSEPMSVNRTLTGARTESRSRAVADEVSQETRQQLIWKN